MFGVFRLLVIALGVAALAACAPKQNKPEKAGAEQQPAGATSTPAKPPADDDDAESGSHY